MLARLRSRAQEEKGFTLIELLVVVLIIGILAAIAIPAFLGQKKGAQDSNSKSLLRNAAIALESYYSENQDFGAVNTALVSTELDAIEPNVTWTTNLAAPAYTAATVDSKEDEVYVMADGESATVAPDRYTLYTKSASGNAFTYVRAADASVTKCKADASGAAFDIACATNEW